MFMAIERLTPAQKKIAISALILALVFFAVWLFLYLPSRNMLRTLKTQLDAAEDEIAEIQALLGRGVSIEQGLTSLKKRHQDVSAQFPAKEEEAIKVFSDVAKKLNIEVESLKSEPIRPLLIGKDKVEIEGRACQFTSVSLRMRCTYLEFVEYAENVKQSLPALLTIEKLKITRNSPGAKELNIDLVFNLYLLPQ